ncbi:MAG: glutaminyl-peptide cyclotransferase [Acidobacteriota bacterium]
MCPRPLRMIRLPWTSLTKFWATAAILVGLVACSPAVPAKDAAVENLRLEVIDSFPHDPAAFTQGLIFDQGELIESSGLYGRSFISRTDPVTGQVLLKQPLDRAYFGEGVAVIDDRVVQLTWKSGVALVFDRNSLDLIDQWGYNGQGWGLAYDGERFVMSDGSSRLTYRSAEDFRWLETVEVTLEGKSVERINELEYVDGKLYGNLWGEERIVRLDAKTGVVDAIIDASGLLTPAESRMVDVLNGIAYDAESDSFWLTGKFWPRMFRVRFVKR